MSNTLTTSRLAAVAGISASYASMILNGHRPCPPEMALRVFQQTGSRIGLLSGATDDEVEVLAKFHAPKLTTSWAT